MNDAYLHFRDGFASILDPRFYTIEWLDGQIWAGLARVWATSDACILVEVKTYPTGATEIHGLAAVGNMDSIIKQLIPQAEAWGRSIGCVSASIASRSGWVRALKSSGYELHQCEIRKDL